MRTGLYGRQIIYNGDKFAGLSLGYYAQGYLESPEHKYIETIKGLLLQINITCSDSTEYKECSGIITKRNMDKKVNRWKNTPFCGFIIRPNKRIYVKRITVDNSGIRGYRKFMLDDDKYILIKIPCINGEIDMLKNMYGNKRKFNEHDLLHMDEYQCDLDIDRIISDGRGDRKITQPNELCGMWGEDGITILIKDNNKYCCIDNDIQSAIKRGSMALVLEEQRLFNDGRCCLIDLDTVYSNRRRN